MSKVLSITTEVYLLALEMRMLTVESTSKNEEGVYLIALEMRKGKMHEPTELVREI